MMSLDMRYLSLLPRLLLGLPFVVFGLNTVLWSVFDSAFMEPPEEMPAAAAAFMDAFTNARFLHPVRGAVEFLGGAMILSGVFLPLGLVMLAPVLVHIVLYHHYVDRTGLAFSYVLLGLGLLLAWMHRDAFRGLWRVSVLPKESLR